MALFKHCGCFHEYKITREDRLVKLRCGHPKCFLVWLVLVYLAFGVPTNQNLASKQLEYHVTCFLGFKQILKMGAMGISHNLIIEP